MAITKFCDLFTTEQKRELALDRFSFNPDASHYVDMINEGILEDVGDGSGWRFYKDKRLKADGYYIGEDSLTASQKALLNKWGYAKKWVKIN